MPILLLDNGTIKRDLDEIVGEIAPLGIHLKHYDRKTRRKPLTLGMGRRR
ncbi:hypothetical protein [Nodularia spumigena]